MNFFRIHFEYTDKVEEPIHFHIIDVLENIENPSNQDQLSLLNLEITDLKTQLSESNSQVQSLSRQLKKLQAKCKSQESQISSLTSALQQSEQKHSEDEKSLKKKLEKSEKINSAHFELMEELKQKYQNDLKQKTEELEKKIIETQKTLNLKTNQVFKLSQVLKDRENKRSSAEIILDELEKKNNEFIEKNAKSEKIIFDLEKRNNELNKRILGLNADFKSNDELLTQKDQQIKKLMSKIKSQEVEIQKLEEDSKAKEKKMKDFEKSGKNLRASVEVKQTKNNRGEESKRMLELLASKEEEVNMMKEMIKSFQVKHPSPSVSTNKFIKNSKLPPITTTGSVKDLKSEIKPKEIFKVKTNFKIREINTKSDKKQFIASPNVSKSVGNNKFPQNKRAIEESPVKSGRINEVYEETPKFGEGTSQNFPDAKLISTEKVIDENEEIGHIVSKIKIWEEGDSFEKNKEGKNEGIRKFGDNYEESEKLDEGECDSIDIGKNEGIGESKFVEEICGEKNVEEKIGELQNGAKDKEGLDKAEDYDEGDNGGSRMKEKKKSEGNDFKKIQEIENDELVEIGGKEDKIEYQEVENTKKLELDGNEERKINDLDEEVKLDKIKSEEITDNVELSQGVEGEEKFKDAEEAEVFKDSPEISKPPEDLSPTELENNEERSLKLEPAAEKVQENIEDSPNNSNFEPTPEKVQENIENSSNNADLPKTSSPILSNSQNSLENFPVPNDPDSKFETKF